MLLHSKVNEVICHGIPDGYPLKDGDIVNVDVTVYHNGYDCAIDIDGSPTTLFFGNSRTAMGLQSVMSRSDES